MEMRTLTNGDFKVAGRYIDGDIWFVGKDVGMSLGYKNPCDCIKNHVDNDDRRIADVLRQRGNHRIRSEVILINCVGVCKLMFKAVDKVRARMFEDWFLRVVLSEQRPRNCVIKCVRDCIPWDRIQVPDEGDLREQYTLWL